MFFFTIVYWLSFVLLNFVLGLIIDGFGSYSKQMTNKGNFSKLKNQTVQKLDIEVYKRYWVWIKKKVSLALNRVTRGMKGVADSKFDKEAASRASQADLCVNDYKMNKRAAHSVPSLSLPDLQSKLDPNNTDVRAEGFREEDILFPEYIAPQIQITRSSNRRAGNSLPKIQVIEISSARCKKCQIKLVRLYKHLSYKIFMLVFIAMVSVIYALDEPTQDPQNTLRKFVHYFDGIVVWLVF